MRDRVQKEAEQSNNHTDGDRERRNLKALTFGGFAAAAPDYLDPVKQMDAAETLYDAKKAGDPARIAAAQKAYDAVLADIAAHQPTAQR